MSTTSAPIVASAPLPAGVAGGVAAVAGAVAAGAALACSELLAGVLPGGSSLIASVGQVAIDLQPPGAKDLVVGLFGTNDKLAFELFIVAVGILAGGALVLVARRRFALAGLGFGAFGAIGFLASLGDPMANPSVTVVSAVVAVAVGLWLLGWLVGPVRAAGATASPGAGRAARMPDWSRRSFLVRAGGVGVGAVAAGVVGLGLLELQRVAPVGNAAPVPPASETINPAARVRPAPSVEG
jgi:hypothetical protein